MLIELTNDTAFGFAGPNLRFLGSTDDFRMLATAILDLTDYTKAKSVVISNLPFVSFKTENSSVIFRSTKDVDKLAFFEGNDIVFVLDPKYWDRLFRFFVLMSWEMRTHYLNYDESELSDLGLSQEINFICSSEYPICHNRSNLATLTTPPNSLSLPDL